MIIMIGLNLSGSAINNAKTCWWLALVAMAIIVVANIWGKGMIKIIPILLGVVGAYVVALIANAMGATALDAAGNVSPLMDFSGVQSSAPIGLQPFLSNFSGSVAKFDVSAILVMGAHCHCLHDGAYRRYVCHLRYGGRELYRGPGPAPDPHW